MALAKVNIAFVTDSLNIPNWEFKMIEKVLALQNVQVVSIVHQNSNKNSIGYFGGNINSKNSFLLNWFYKFETRLFKQAQSALKQKKIQELLTQCDIIKLENSKDESAISKLKKLDVDIFVQLGFSETPQFCYNLAKFGVWKYFFGNLERADFGPPGLIEVLNKKPDSYLGLIGSKDNKNWYLLNDTYSCTDKISWLNNLSNSLNKAASFLSRKLNELLSLGNDDFYLKSATQLNSAQLPKSFDYSGLGSIKLIFGLISVYTDFIRAKIANKKYFKQWVLYIGTNTGSNSKPDFSTYDIILPPIDRSWADPFLYTRENKNYLFIEEYIFTTKKGFLSVMELHEDGTYSNPIKVLETDYHLSYPFLIEDEGKLYMIPETSQHNTIELFECVNFPLEWKLNKLIKSDICAVDSTIIKRDGLYWMFNNIKENKGASSHDELFLFYANSLTSDNWIAHPQNPIVSDVRGSRPAGNIINENGKLFRVAQNCSNHYGYGMQIAEIIELNKDTYSEKIVSSIHPNFNKDVISTHTYNVIGNKAIIDAQINRKRK
ncbi:MAG: glucosamine inositolphosphorylceramide transferase family protein, partial [Bacteroidia bacterium]